MSSPSSGRGHEVAEFQPRIRTFVHPQAGELTFTVGGLQVPAGGGGRHVVFTPRPTTETRKRLPLTRDEFAAAAE